MRHKNQWLTQDFVKELVHYDPETGIFTWRKWRGGRAHAGTVATQRDRAGYLRIKIGGEIWSASRLAWLYMTGEWPDVEIDHRDRNKSNNGWSNLRRSTRSQNTQNTPVRIDSMSGVKGVAWRPAMNKWRATIRANNVRHNLGHFDTIEEAIAARTAAEQRLHGAFATGA